MITVEITESLIYIDTIPAVSSPDFPKAHKQLIDIIKKLRRNGTFPEIRRETHAKSRKQYIAMAIIINKNSARVIRIVKEVVPQVKPLTI